MNNIIKFEQVALDCSAIALVNVLRVSKRESSIDVLVSKIFFGDIPEKIKLGYPTMWGIHGDNWFKKNEECIVLVLPSNTTMGTLGRMPIVNYLGNKVVESYCENSDYFGEFSIKNDEDRNLITFIDFKEELMKKILRRNNL